jgi:uncharacterized membrane protein YqgA involved in biofilm formation
MPEAAQLAFGLRRCAARGEARDIRLLARAIQNEGEVAHIVKLAAGGFVGELARLDEVLAAQLHRVDAQLRAAKSITRSSA